MCRLFLTAMRRVLCERKCTTRVSLATCQTYTPAASLHAGSCSAVALLHFLRSQSAQRPFLTAMRRVLCEHKCTTRVSLETSQTCTPVVLLHAGLYIAATLLAPRHLFVCRVQEGGARGQHIFLVLVLRARGCSMEYHSPNATHEGMGH